jgi:hypothetical protein
MMHSNGAETLILVIERYTELLEDLEVEINSAGQLDGFKLLPNYSEQMEFITMEVGKIHSSFSEQDRIVRYQWGVAQLYGLKRQLEADQLNFLKHRAHVLLRQFFGFRRDARSHANGSRMKVLTRECEHSVKEFVHQARQHDATVHVLRPRLVGIQTRMHEISEHL